MHTDATHGRAGPQHDAGRRGDPVDRRVAAVGVLMAHYSLSVVGEARVAGRAVDVVAARRPGAAADAPDAARFWLDRDSGLVLRREVYDRHGRTTRASAFVEITIGRADGGRRAPGTEPGPRASTPRRWTGCGTAAGTVPTVLPGPLTLVDARAAAARTAASSTSATATGSPPSRSSSSAGRLDEVALADHRRDVIDGHVV